MLTNIKVRLRMIIDKVKNYWQFYLFFFIMISFIVISLFFACRYSWQRRSILYDHIMSIETTTNDNTLTIPEGSEVYIVQPNGEQEVVIIGNPENIKVKPKKK